MKEITLNQAIGYAKNISYVCSILIVIVPLALISLRYLKLNFRMIKNLRKKIRFLNASNKFGMRLEIDTLKQINLFKLDTNIINLKQDYPSIQNIKEGLIVLRYCEEYNKYPELIDHMKMHNIPVVIYAKQGEIRDQQHWEAFNSYAFSDVANTPSRLCMIVLNLLTMTP